MDFQNILSLAAQNSSSKQVKKKYSAQLGPPVKEKKEKDAKSDVVKKLIEEKEREKREAEEARERIKRKIREAEERKKREKELKVKREKEEEERKRKEEERKNRFRIPKKGENSSGAEKNEIKPSTSASSNSVSSSSSPSSSKGKSSESKRQETDRKSDQKDPKRISKVSDKVKNISSSKSENEKLDPATVKPTALSSNQRNSHLYDEIERRKVSNETDIERKRREFEEKRARLLQQIKVKGLEKEKPAISKKTEKVKSSKDLDRKSVKKKSEKPTDQVKNVDKSSLTNSKNGAISTKQDSSTVKVSVSEKIKSHNSGKKMPPPLGFDDLLKLAQVKASEPVTIESVKKAEKKEPERLMTKDERERFLEEQACKYRKSSVTGKPQSSGDKLSSRREINERISKHSRDKLVRTNKEGGSAPKLKGLLTNGVETNSPVSGKVNMTSEKSQMKRKSDIMPSTQSSSSKMISNSKSSSSLSRSGDQSDAKKRRLDSPSTSKSSPSAGPSSTRPSGPSGRPNGHLSKSAQRQRAYDSENENVLVCGPPKPKPEVALNPFDRIYGQIKKNNPKPEIRKRRIESDEEESEYDEEMEGFITDEGSDLEEDYQQDMDYSKHIRQIFGYDKRKYKYESDRDIANMESNFAQQMKEEARSARLGLQEDLEDIKREEEELRRKMEKKMKK